MGAAAVDAVLEQATRFTQRLVDVYESDIAAGEVGPDGSARATDEDILGERPPTALLYGRVQSGKTAAMTLTTALALDNGFRVIIVLTADSLALVTQTANRFKAVDGPRVFSTVTDDQYEWEGQEAEIAADVATDGLILVCAKDAFHLPEVIQFLNQIDASAYPAIVFDDEADAATPDTTLAARTAGAASAPAFPSVINSRVIENMRPGEEGESINEVLPHGLYIQVTATPFILFLQREDARLRPNVPFLLEPGEGYSGGEIFFAGFDSTAQRPNPPIVLVPNQELATIQRRRIPPGTGLAASIDVFLVAAADLARRSGGWPAEGYKHLSHTSLRINHHTVVAGHIERFVNERRRQLRDDPTAAQASFATAHGELLRTVPDLAGMDVLAPLISDAVRQVEVVRVNSNTDVPRFGPRVNFMVGGNILGRGLTIDDLLVTYYLREAQTPQMDTMWQHARMYGYRQLLMPFTRVYVPSRTAVMFRGIHESEEQLRDMVRRVVAGEDVPVRIVAGTRATRRNATEPSVLRVFTAGIQQIAPHYVEENADVAAQIREKLLELEVPIDGANGRVGRTVRIPFDDAVSLLEEVPIREGDPGRWAPGAVRALMESYRTQYADGVPVYVRGLRAEATPPGGWVRGRLSGEEIGIIRGAAAGVPALVLLYLADPNAPNGWYPELVMPANAATYVVNPL